ncbi:phosphatidate cytidylyltransferase [Marinobacterium sp. YM272]|uniref:phosphatidate cytidylyltransferase n=1 Tax=Marinobacterium sp. YM272 TaxID=3421654 RepID=UPI003D7F8B39
MIKQRVITGVILGALVLLGVFWLSPGWFAFFAAAVVALAAHEWGNFAALGQLGRSGYALLCLALVALLQVVTPLLDTAILTLAGLFWLVACYVVVRYPAIRLECRWLKLLVGLVVIVPTWLALTSLKALTEGELALVMLLLLVWGADTGAYCAGKLLGRRKLIPNVSPGKTLEGMLGGLATCILIGVIIGLSRELPPVALVYLVALSLITGLASVLGDLFESLFKRERGIKDSGRILPGHGGILDRIDSLTAAAPVFMLGIHWAPMF